MDLESHKGKFNSHRVYISMFHNHPDACYIMDKFGRIRTVNPATEVLTRCSEGEIIGHIFDDFVISDDLPKARMHFEFALKGAPQRYEIGLINGDNEEINVHVINIPIIDNSEVIGILGIARDITTQKQVFLEQKSQLDLLTSVFNTMTDAVGIMDLDGRLIEVNSAYERMVGWNREDLIGEHVRFIPDEYTQVVKAHHTVAMLGKQTKYEVPYITRDGKTKDGEIIITPLRDDYGNVVALAWFIRDISERKEAEERLLETKKMTVAQEMAAGVAHEINNPLTALRGFVQLLQGESGDERYLKIMEREVERIEGVIAELLVLAKPQLISVDDTNIVDCVQYAIEQVEPLHPHVEFNVIENEGTHVLPANEQQIRQMLLNIIENGADAMPNGGEVRVVVESGSNDVRIRVVDTGCGIPEELLEKLGEPFYTTKSRGTGLGLMTSYRIVQNHQGRIEIESQENVGTTVTIILPKRIRQTA